MSGLRIDSATSEDLLAHAAQRVNWAGRALEFAASDLHEACSGGGSFEGLAELVLVEAGLVTRMAEDIDNRRHEDDRLQGEN